MSLQSLGHRGRGLPRAPVGGAQAHGHGPSPSASPAPVLPGAPARTMNLPIPLPRNMAPMANLPATIGRHLFHLFPPGAAEDMRALSLSATAFNRFDHKRFGSDLLL